MAATFLVPGQIFAGDYRVVGPLSKGGMGSVYETVQLSTSERRALKIMHPSLAADPKSRARFDQEARMASHIASIHVVHVIQAGIDEATQIPWLTMELLDGEDLGSLASRQGRFDRAFVMTLFEQICHALELAHRARIVHRDLKPENIFLARAQSPNVPFTAKILDFGIAKMARDTTSTDGIGSPLWMAPEQAVEGSDVRPATDVWALGLIAFRLLSGRPFWKTANDGSSVFKLYDEITTAPIEAAVERAGSLGCDPDTLPDGFDAWFARCVARDPAKRFQEAGAVRDALLPLLAAAPASMAGKGLAFGSTAPREAFAPPAGGTTTGAALAASATVPQHAAPRKVRWIPWAGGALGVSLVAVAGVAVYAHRTRAPSPAASALSAPSNRGCEVTHRCPDPLHEVCSTPPPKCTPSGVAGELELDLEDAPHRWRGGVTKGEISFDGKGGRTIVSLYFGEGDLKGYSNVTLTLPDDVKEGTFVIAERRRGSAVLQVGDNGAISQRYLGGFQGVEGELELTSVDYRFGGHVDGKLHAKLLGGNVKPPLHGVITLRFHAEIPN